MLFRNCALSWLYVASAAPALTSSRIASFIIMPKRTAISHTTLLRARSNSFVNTIADVCAYIPNEKLIVFRLHPKYVVAHRYVPFNKKNQTLTTINLALTNYDASPLRDAM